MRKTISCYRLILVVCCLSGAVLPPPAQAGLFSISPAKERRMGEDAARAIESQSHIVSGPVAEWVEAIGQRLAATSNSEFEYSFKVIDSPEINAFALPGGYIYVFTGLRKVAQNDDELAAVLAHEITHSEQHHFAKQYKKSTKRGLGLTILSAVAGLPNFAQQVLGIVDFAITQKYSRSQESESDEMGMQRMARAGFNPQGMVTLLDKLSKESGSLKTLDKWFGNHPDAKKRLEAARREVGEISTLQAQKNPLVTPVYPTWSGEASLSISMASKAP
ncbi:MAG TPA: M48 family metallopeptidase [Abditibacteriaceae bacterium]|nr:M48 family metallopeptidase [Abditibacteriaceae bacterium]